MKLESSLKAGVASVLCTLIFSIKAEAEPDQQTLTPDGAEIKSKDRLDTVIVHGRGLALIGEASAASEGVVGYADFEDRPLLRVGELVEVIPGAVATQHSGEGKANQYFLRGFNLDHGTDFSARIDDVPINLRTHGHGQGYLDLNFVIPELVERVDYRKGPYAASNGDFSVAGSAHYSTYDKLPYNFAEISTGEFGYLRGVVAGDISLGGDTRLLLALESEAYDGPWVLSQDLEKINGFAKLTHSAGPWTLQLSASAYDSSWVSTDQIPRRAVKSGLIDRFGFIDDDLGGETTRFSLATSGAYAHADGAMTAFSAYAVSYKFSLWSDFTYFVEDPVDGDEFEQLDARTYFGGAIRHERSITDRLRLRVGGETRFDDISDVGLFRTADRARLSTVRRDRVGELSVGLWGEAEYELSDRLRATLGIRGDYYNADVTALSNPVNGGSASDSLISPSAAIAWRVTDSLELYANYGEGFHSNDVRGATIRVEPVSGDPADRVPILVRAKGGELGARFEAGNFNASVAVFTLDLDSELVFVGDAGTTEANDGSTRTGVETSLFWRPNDWLFADLSAAYTDAEFDIPGNETEIPQAVESVVGGGVLARFDPFTLSARLRHFGKAPLLEDGSVESDPTTIINASGSYEWKQVTFGVELLNVFNAEDADITYYFASQLAGETSPVDDVHFHPVEPRQPRFSLRYRF
ncbi:TonB-dependent receptor [Hyphomonas oceanitis]|uniref:TonB-dependent receptor n=1 Tax=Hyphomonas oceanitis SCH89 TaxID=1280953 RepID=A0A059G573_9PROT|nr:TonB-dependent receptor [Hyphomonas oceanitis]KDA01864.1 TonB-dependent receptor [Hyphomonas oceanitis SCH89]